MFKKLGMIALTGAITFIVVSKAIADLEFYGGQMTINPRQGMVIPPVHGIFSDDPGIKIINPREGMVDSASPTSATPFLPFLSPLPFWQGMVDGASATSATPFLPFLSPLPFWQGMVDGASATTAPQGITAGDRIGFTRIPMRAVVPGNEYLIRANRSVLHNITAQRQVTASSHNVNGAHHRTSDLEESVESLSMGTSNITIVDNETGRTVFEEHPADFTLTRDPKNPTNFTFTITSPVVERTSR